VKSIREPIGESGHVLLTENSLVFEDRTGATVTFDKLDFGNVIAAVMRIAARGGLAERAKATRVIGD
jgi:hypothetical protein